MGFLQALFVLVRFIKGMLKLFPLLKDLSFFVLELCLLKLYLRLSLTLGMLELLGKGVTL